MATIKMAANVYNEIFLRVKALAAETERADINWSGADIRVERGEFNCVEDAVDDNYGTELLNSGFRAIDGD